MKSIRLFGFVILIALGVSACDILEPVKQERKPDVEVVLSAFLTPGAPVSVTLRRTIPLEQYYPFRDLTPFAIHDAQVVVSVDGTDYQLVEADPSGHPGVYVDSSLIANSLATYSVDITFPPAHEFSDRHITGSTTVPGPAAMTATLNPSQVAKGGTFDNLIFPKQLADPSRFGTTSALTPFTVEWQPVDEAAGYMVGIMAHDTSGTGILRWNMYESWLDGDFRSPNQRQFLQKSGLLTLPDSVRADIFWALFNLQGWQDVVLIAADRAYFDYFRTVVNGAGSSGADADQGVALNVHGGLGVFGAYSSDTLQVYINPREYLPSQDTTRP